MSSLRKEDLEKIYEYKSTCVLCGSTRYSHTPDPEKFICAYCRIRKDPRVIDKLCDYYGVSKDD